MRNVFPLRVKVALETCHRGWRRANVPFRPPKFYPDIDIPLKGWAYDLDLDFDQPLGVFPRVTNELSEGAFCVSPVELAVLKPHVVPYTAISRGRLPFPEHSS